MTAHRVDEIAPAHLLTGNTPVAASDEIYRVGCLLQERAVAGLARPLRGVFEVSTMQDTGSALDTKHLIRVSAPTRDWLKVTISLRESPYGGPSLASYHFEFYMADDDECAGWEHHSLYFHTATEDWHLSGGGSLADGILDAVRKYFKGYLETVRVRV